MLAYSLIISKQKIISVPLASVVICAIIAST